MEGGTEKPGVNPRVSMPEGMSIRYDQPAAAIADYITGYHVYASKGPAATGQVEWFLPGTANIRVALDAGPIAVRIARRTFGPLPPATLFGPTSSAMRTTTNGGTMIGIGISALGWARLFRAPAGRYRNQIVALDTVLGEERARALTAILAGSDRAGEVKPLLDTFFAGLLGPVHPDEPVVRRLMALIVDDETHDLATAARLLNVEPHRLRRLSVRHFGFPPKMLLVRARFLRSFLGMFRTGDHADYSTIAASYFDTSHFLRDANTFLGMTPRRFMAMATPFLDASVRTRAAVLGAATQALHDIDAPRPLDEADRAP